METVNLIKQTDLEVEIQALVARYKEDQKITPNSDLTVDRANVITRQIKTAYIFLRELGKPHSDMTIKEFKTAHAQIKKIWQDKLGEHEEQLRKTLFFRWIRKLSISRKIANARYILDHSYYYDANMLDTTFYGQWTYHREEVPTNLPELVEEILQVFYGINIKTSQITRRN